MATVTYLAARNLISVDPPFKVEGIDISAAAVDDSYNSVSTVLSGLLANQFIVVSGFDIIDNIGSKKLEFDSTANKIQVVDTPPPLYTDLVNEAAGNSIIIEGFIHGIGEEYTLEFDASDIDYPDTVERFDVEPISGADTETIFIRENKFIEIRTVPFHKDDKPKYLEFWWSVSRGETFTLDAEGFISSPDDPKLCRLVDKSIRLNRITGTQYFTLAFRAKVVE